MEQKYLEEYVNLLKAKMYYMISSCSCGSGKCNCKSCDGFDNACKELDGFERRHYVKGVK